MTLGDTPFDRSALKRRRRITIYDLPVWVASPEDLVIYKLVSGRDRDLVDIRAIFKRQRPLDGAYLRKWAGWWEKEGVKSIRKRVNGLLG